GLANSALVRASQAVDGSEVDNLPAVKQVRILNAMQSGFPDPTPALKQWLTSNGYVVAAGDASVASLRTVGGDGVFYLSGHGGVDDASLWVRTTTVDDTRCDPNEKDFDFLTCPDSKLSEELALDEIVVTIADDHWDPASQEWISADRYAITAAFVDE